MPVNIVFQKWENGYCIANVATSNTVAVRTFLSTARRRGKIFAADFSSAAVGLPTPDARPARDTMTN